METVQMLRSLNVEPKCPGGWLTFERRNWIALLFVAALGGFSAGNGHTTQGAVQNISSQLGQKAAALKKEQTEEIPKLKAIAGCQTVRGNVAIDVVVNSKKGTAIDLSAVPDCPTLPVAKH